MRGRERERGRAQRAHPCRRCTRKQGLAGELPGGDRPGVISSSTDLTNKALDEPLLNSTPVPFTSTNIEFLMESVEGVEKISPSEGALWIIHKSRSLWFDHGLSDGHWR